MAIKRTIKTTYEAITRLANATPIIRNAPADKVLAMTFFNTGTATVNLFYPADSTGAGGGIAITAPTIYPVRLDAQPGQGSDPAFRDDNIQVYFAGSGIASLVVIREILVEIEEKC